MNHGIHVFVFFQSSIRGFWSVAMLAIHKTQKRPTKPGERKNLWKLLFEKKYNEADKAAT